ncbi:GFA family protein [Sphingomonas sp. TZW2008]|uniref:GFA family protein n=1 Tax=Sphingomonas sp. TZW2008 TaxID=1917973 RepID=UPI000A270BFC|nr:GFA family protein [Sphingomonas sp. TZW2008]
MIHRRATCQCGAAAIDCEGEPIRVSVCHCLNCQRRSGAPFAAQARFRDASVSITGNLAHWRRTSARGGVSDHHFCRTCGPTLFYHVAAEPGIVSIPIGGFGDAPLPPPVYSVYESRKRSWVAIVGDAIEHYD